MNIYTFECGGCDGDTVMVITTPLDLKSMEQRPTCPCGSAVPMFLVKE